MAHPTFVDRSFIVIRRRAAARMSHWLSTKQTVESIERARNADRLAETGIHAFSTRRHDRLQQLRRNGMDIITAIHFGK